ncbi:MULTISPECIES: hypothetical protein [Cyanophyceae]|uniref:hypothetical protein n=1 Tax=Cyanophyceae TaxID=3028117 RepID=UPI00016DCEFC|nr:MULTISPECIES: hypothetical protein [Cyanophyceae]ACB01007.1 hypothetical protein SYNPCC7002_F0076 [Picosynechococcus sp. PCC 7002]SMH58378.1 hypothetical protein SAMN06272755_3158 [Picosynechococcus sp. OG1]SMQ86406.1 hypothetical protein SAMN06272774_3149 [Synechococcus sp. 7002]
MSHSIYFKPTRLAATLSIPISLLLLRWGQPLWAMIPLSVYTILFIPKGLQAFQRLQARSKFLATLAGLAMLGFCTSSPVLAIEYSFLLQATQTAMETCIFSQIAGLTVLSGLIFTAIRGSVVLGLAFVAFEAWQEKRKQQDSSEQIKTIVYAIVSIVVVGAIEPLIMGSGCGG